MAKTYRKPALTSNSEERKATWTELFYDLAFVVAVAATAHSLSSGTSATGVIEFVLIFVLIHWAWMGYTFYCDRFDTDDFIHRAMALLQMALVVSIASLHDWTGSDYRAFVACYCALRSVTIFANLYAGWHIPIARTITGPYAVGFTISLFPLVAGLWVDDYGQRLILVAATAVLQLTPPIYLVLKRTFESVNTYHLPERMGLFVTLSLGESLIALANVGGQAHMSAQIFVTGMLGLVTVFSFWWIYFSRLDGAVLRHSGASALIWVYTHIVLAMAVIALAVGMGENLQLVLLPGSDERATLMLVAWALALLAHVVIAATNNVANDRRVLDAPLVTCLLVAGGIAVLSTAYGGAMPITHLQLIAASGIVLLLVELFLGPEPRQDNKSI